jgi:hypothetical protein
MPNGSRFLFCCACRAWALRVRARTCVRRTRQPRGRSTEGRKLGARAGGTARRVPAQGAVASPAPAPPTHPVAAPVPGEGGGTPSLCPRRRGRSSCPAGGSSRPGTHDRRRFGCARTRHVGRVRRVPAPGRPRARFLLRNGAAVRRHRPRGQGHEDREARRPVRDERGSNQYVVLREATYFYEDPTERAQYIASHTINRKTRWS